MPGSELSCRILNAPPAHVACEKILVWGRLWMNEYSYVLILLLLFFPACSPVASRGYSGFTRCVGIRIATIVLLLYCIVIVLLQIAQHVPQEVSEDNSARLVLLRYSQKTHLLDRDQRRRAMESGTYLLAAAALLVLGEFSSVLPNTWRATAWTYSSFTYSHHMSRWGQALYQLTRILTKLKLYFSGLNQSINSCTCIRNWLFEVFC